MRHFCPARKEYAASSYNGNDNNYSSNDNDSSNNNKDENEIGNYNSDSNNDIISYDDFDDYRITT